MGGAELRGGEVPVGEVGGFLQLGIAVGGRGVVGEVGAGGDAGGNVWVGGEVETGGDDDRDAACEGVGDEGEEGCEWEKVDGEHAEFI